jgi:D-alanyl-D-alanine dipeptidase
VSAQHLRRFGALALYFCCMTVATLVNSLSIAEATLDPAAQFPAAAPLEQRQLIGEYGTAESLLTIYESQQTLFADGAGMRRALLRRVSATVFSTADTQDPKVPLLLTFELDQTHRAAAVVVGHARLPFIDIGQQAVDTIRSGARSNADALREQALRSTPPVEPTPKRKTDLVDLASVDPSIKFDIRYATSNNFMGFPLYERPAAYLQRPAAEALRRAASTLAPKGYGLLVHDAYRPWFVTKMFWDATPAAAHIFVADPAEGSRHNRGCAVDLTLYEVATGNPVQMTGSYDEMSPRSFADFIGGTSRQRFLRDLLRTAMEQQGFAVYPQEWWHFDYKDWRDYAIGNVTFGQLDTPSHADGFTGHVHQ